jgi:hypothetical protein
MTEKGLKKNTSIIISNNLHEGSVHPKVIFIFDYRLKKFLIYLINCKIRFSKKKKIL